MAPCAARERARERAPEACLLDSKRTRVRRRRRSWGAVAVGGAGVCMCGDDDDACCWWWCACWGSVIVIRLVSGSSPWLTPLLKGPNPSMTNSCNVSRHARTTLLTAATHSFALPKLCPIDKTSRSSPTGPPPPPSPLSPCVCVCVCVYTCISLHLFRLSSASASANNALGPILAPSSNERSCGHTPGDRNASKMGRSLRSGRLCVYVNRCVCKGERKKNIDRSDVYSI